MSKIINLETFNIKPVKFSDWEYAWKITDIFSLLDFITMNNQVVLGGDILNNSLEHNYDSWHYEPTDCNSVYINVKESCDKARKYVKNYIDRNGSNFYVILIVE